MGFCMVLGGGRPNPVEMFGTSPTPAPTVFGRKNRKTESVTDHACVRKSHEYGVWEASGLMNTWC